MVSEERTTRRPRILLTLAEQELPVEAATWAIQLARPLGADLYALRVLHPHGRALGDSVPKTNVDAELGARARVLIRRGEYEPEIRRFAEALEPTLMVVAPHAAGQVLATRLAYSTRVPVLLARGLCRGGPMLAATDLEDLRYPILRYARNAACWIATPLVFLHNVTTSETARVDERSSSLLATRMPLLKRAVDLLEAPAEIVLRASSSAPTAIIDTARKRRADLIVLGTRGTATAGLPAATVPECVVRDARQSMLLVPLAGRRFGGAAAGIA